MYFKHLAILPDVASLAGTVIAAPIAADLSLVAGKFRHQGSAAAAPATGTQAAAAVTGGTLCTNTDQSAATFGGNDPDENLPLCSTVASPFECTNIQAVATDFNLPICSTA
ncbi:hypothetical protein B0H17DRAFT_1145816 [Mycena rosella]|uniref:Uncharacterized protein n=1 Tax=Mycena rosella TaxID=1033263 RepID=A0AAD7G1D1_MYCRO|nr:hypothetical protein B0H17DRAFT_1145816 [Mycena rosella]